MAGQLNEGAANKETTARDGRVTIPRTVQRVMHSRDGRSEYRICVAYPGEEAPPAGFPVIYLLDANAVFGTMVETMRVLASRTDKTGVVPAIIVGIGYDTELPFSSARHYDFTMPVDAAELPQSPGGRVWPRQGGAEAFLQFIEGDLKPAIEREFRIDRARQTIFGHSLGGLFVLHMLFVKPQAFRTYVAGSPSIHWNKRFLEAKEREFAARLERERLETRVYVAAGELEQTHKSRINDNARELCERLSALADRGVSALYKEFEGEGHISVLPVLISHAVRFALKDTSGRAAPPDGGQF